MSSKRHPQHDSGASEKEHQGSNNMHSCTSLTTEHQNCQPRLKSLPSSHADANPSQMKQRSSESSSLIQEPQKTPKRIGLPSSSRYWNTVLAPSKSQSSLEEARSTTASNLAHETATGKSAAETKECSSSSTFSAHAKGKSCTSRNRQRQRLVCPICAMQFDNRSEKTNHMQNAHNPEETFPCRYPGCGKVFGHRSSRSRHETAHRWVRK